MSSEKAENKICQNCKKDFTIEPEDFNFYEKIKVSPPTFCPECRLIRKLIWRNERSLYKRRCEKCKKEIISIYDPDSKLTIYCRECWQSDDWDPMSFGFSYDSNKNFFEQFSELFRSVPLVSRFVSGTLVNSEYINFFGNAKNCYLNFGGKDNEQVLYIRNTSFSKDSMDIYNGNKLELCYEDVQCDKSYNLSFSAQCENCTDSMFLYDCRNCQNCFGCTNLRNKNYCIWNEQCTREEYFKKLKEYDLANYDSLQNVKRKFSKFVSEAIHKYAYLVNASNSTGDNISNARNCKHCFDIYGTGSENSKYTYYAVLSAKEVYDTYGMPNGERLYESIANGFDYLENSDYYFCFFIRGSSRMYYSINCSSSHDCFGCVGLHKKQYCIFNKQYNKEEYEKMVKKIIEHMNKMPYVDSRGLVYQYGEFFPKELSPFAYNETIAQEHFLIDKNTAENLGYTWKEPKSRSYNIEISNDQIPKSINEVNDQILNKVIECAHKGNCLEQCTEVFKIIEPELSFYRRKNLPLPRLCSNCRHYERLYKKNPLKLWSRTCMCSKENHQNHKGNCEVEFETSYAPDRPEIVYCEKCYQQEVY